MPDVTAGAVTEGRTPFDLSAVIERVHFAYRRDEAAGRFRGGHATYGVEADAERVTLRGYRTRRRLAPSSAEPRALGGISERQGRDNTVEGGALHLETARVERGGRPLARPRAGDLRVADDGHLEILRTHVVESLRNRADGVEQSWELSQRPGGAGDLRVRVEPTGMVYAGETEKGVHFADRRTGLGFRYSHGTWIDAAGRKARVPARWLDGGIELIVSAEVLDASTYPAVLDPIISPEIELDEPVPLPAPDGQTNPSATSNGSEYLVVWEDTRSGRSAIYGARVSGTGAVLDPTGILISSSEGLAVYPSVAWGGDGYLVVWIQAEYGGGAQYRIAGARVSATGAVLDSGGLSILPILNPGPPLVASSGSDYLVVWSDSLQGGGVRGARISRTGDLLDPAGFAISNGNATASMPTPASNGDEYLVVWSDSRSGTSSDIYGARVDHAGRVLDADDLAISTAERDQTSPSVAWDGSEFVVVWLDRRNVVDSAVFGARVSPAGAVLDPTGISISTSGGGDFPGVAYNGRELLVAWGEVESQDSLFIHGARLSTEGTVLGEVRGPSGVRAWLDSGLWRVALASNGSDFLLAWWQVPVSSSADIVAVRISDAGMVLDPPSILISTSVSAQRSPTAAWSGSEYLVVWTDERNGAADIYGVRVRPNGTLLDPAGIAISTASGQQGSPRVAWGRTGFLVVWDDERDGDSDIFGARVTGDGRVLDETGVRISIAPGEQERPAVAGGGDGVYLVVWDDQGSRGRAIHGARVGETGTVLDEAGIAISSAEGMPGRPSVASSGDQYLVTWLHGGSGSDIFGARVSKAGTVLDPTGIAISTAEGDQGSPSVAWGGREYLVAWVDAGTNFASDIYGARVDEAGTVLDPGGIPISTATGAQASPSVASSGDQFLVVWEDGRSTTTEVYGTSIREGAIENREGDRLTADPIAEALGPTIVGGNAGSWLLTYTRSAVLDSFGVPGARARLVRSGSTCGAQDECGPSDIDQAGGCGCAVAIGGKGRSEPWGALLVLLALAVAARRATGASTAASASGAAARPTPRTKNLRLACRRRRPNRRG
ncbi:MAG: hypothetical protein IT384_33225 [Deltaproteobacteria bacterium]|nr:hypothetical protein [Deltaproteobacteria bacterium]